MLSADSGASCGLELQGEGPFLVFASSAAAVAAPGIALEGGQYSASLCGGTAPLTDELAAEVAGLGDAPGGPEGSPAPDVASPAPGTAGVPASGDGSRLPLLGAGAVALLLGGWLALRYLRRRHNPRSPASSPIAASK